MRTPFLVASLMLLLSGCMAVEKEIMITKSFFNENEVEWFKEEGNNTVKGSALLRQSGGGVVTCAGNAVTATPFSTYALERMTLIYNNSQQGYKGLASATKQIDQGAPAYLEMAEETLCDAQGYFKFSNLPEGEYFLTTEVSWVIANRIQGGYLMKRISVSGGETVEVVLTQ